MAFEPLNSVTAVEEGFAFLVDDAILAARSTGPVPVVQHKNLHVLRPDSSAGEVVGVRSKAPTVRSSK